MFQDAKISSDGKYRYSLVREWDKEKPKVLFIGLNPSTADEKTDDPTIRRCIGFAKNGAMEEFLSEIYLRYDLQIPH